MSSTTMPSAAPTPKRTGRRAGDANTKQHILDAARIAFSDKGFSATSMRHIAREAGVDVALISYYFGGKEQLFTAVMDIPVDPGDVIEEAFADGVDSAGPRLVRMFLAVWEDPHSGPAMNAMFRGAASREESRRLLSDFASKQIIARYAVHITAPNARERAGLAASQLLGMAVMRYVIRVEPLASMSHDDLVADLGPTIQRYLTGDLASDEKPRRRPRAKA